MNSTLCPPRCRQPPFPNPRLALQPPSQSILKHMGFEQLPCLSLSCLQPAWDPGMRGRGGQGQVSLLHVCCCARDAAPHGAKHLSAQGRSSLWQLPLRLKAGWPHAHFRKEESQPALKL